jgi:ethanolamine utilization microcompartment shell protein EutL
MADVSLRTYVFLDSLSPSWHVHRHDRAASCPSRRTPRCSSRRRPELIINRITDVALKAASARRRSCRRARFGLLEIHHRDKGQVQLGGRAVLDYLGVVETDRVKPRVVSDQVIRAVEPHHAQVINKMRYGDMLISGESLFILECEPAGYIAFAANEALKAARVKLVDASLFGAFGRLYLSGPEADIDAARAAAIRALENVSGKPGGGASG